MVELTLHRYARTKGHRRNNFWTKLDHPDELAKLADKALCQNFDAKVKLAKFTKLIDESRAQSIRCLHKFRNAAHHAGAKHEAIAHSLAMFYFVVACELLIAYHKQSGGWSAGLHDSASHRALKYLGKPNFIQGKDTFEQVWPRLLEVADSLPFDLTADLFSDLSATIDETEKLLTFLEDNTAEMSREDLVLEAQARTLSLTDEGFKFAQENQCPPDLLLDEYFHWFAKNYPFPERRDPLPTWRKRAKQIGNQANRDLALKQYCDFLGQTEKTRSSIYEAVIELDVKIQRAIDQRRGK